jgi:hypothetical protein
MQTAAERSAAGERAALARQQEYMALAPGVGIVPEQFRNRGYDKLEFGPGEGGLGQLLASRETDGGALTRGDMLAAIEKIVAGMAGGTDNEPRRGPGRPRKEVTG